MVDTYVNVDWQKCQRCYKCVELCTETYKKYGTLGYLIIDEYTGEPEYVYDNPYCHHCEAEVNGQKINYACKKICPTGAMEITRW